MVGQPKRSDKQVPVKLDGKSQKVQPIKKWLDKTVDHAKKTGK